MLAERLRWCALGLVERVYHILLSWFGTAWHQGVNPARRPAETTNKDYVTMIDHCYSTFHIAEGPESLLDGYNDKAAIQPKQWISQSPDIATHHQVGPSDLVKILYPEHQCTVKRPALSTSIDQPSVHVAHRSEVLNGETGRTLWCHQRLLARGKTQSLRARLGIPEAFSRLGENELRSRTVCCRHCRISYGPSAQDTVDACLQLGCTRKATCRCDKFRRSAAHGSCAS